MYNNIPSERTSKRTIFIMLLFCVTLVSVLAAGYFAWIAKDMQTRFAQLETLEELESANDEIQAILPVEDEEAVVPVFTYPEVVQAPRRTDTYEGESLLMAMLNDWEEMNKDTGYCVQVRSYLEGVSYPVSYNRSTDEILANAGVRSALISYFGVSSFNEQQFFDGIDAAIDENDMFAQDATMCASSNGVRKFLLLDDVQTIILEDGRESTQSYPEILEWAETSTAGFSWIFYPTGAYRVTDGYRFYPDWYGNVLVQTGYGDVGYNHWEIQLLETLGGIPAIDLLEKCSSEPNDDWSASIITCEVRYVE